MGRRRGVSVPLPGGSGALLGSGARAMRTDFLHSTSRASNMALRPPPAVRQDGRSELFGPFRKDSADRWLKAPSAISGDGERPGFFGSARERLRRLFGNAAGADTLSRERSVMPDGGGPPRRAAGLRESPKERSGGGGARPRRTIVTAPEAAVRQTLPSKRREAAERKTRVLVEGTAEPEHKPTDRNPPAARTY